LTLLTGGFFLNLGIIRLYPTLAVAVFWDPGGETWSCTPSEEMGPGLSSSPPFAQVINDSRMDKGRQFFRINGEKTIFIARSYPGSGRRLFCRRDDGDQAGQFLLLDFLGALILIPLLLLLGIILGEYRCWGRSLPQIDHPSSSWLS